MSFDVFGYGSLVNRRTLPPYLRTRRASVAGWRRAWRASSRASSGGVCALSVVAAPGATIDGLVVTFADDVRPVIDAREQRYDPLPVVAGEAPAIIFRVRADHDRFGDAACPIHLSYLDAVVQGFLREFGADGVDRFADTTDGWHVPILDDRDAPRYPRAQHLTDAELDAVDALLDRVGATLLPDD